MFLVKKLVFFCTFAKNLYKRKYMLTVNNLSQFGKRILFDEVNTTLHMVIFMELSEPNGAGKSTFLKIISGEMDPTSGHVHLETGKRMSVLSQNHNMFDEHTYWKPLLWGTKHYIPSKGNGRALFRL
jgi:ATPase subunit of ABC transporter with duplicated ATPase domains